MVGRVAAVAVLALMAPAAVAWGRDFENPATHDTAQDFTRATQRDDTPNDPGYDNAEPDDPDTQSPSTNVFDERYDLFGFPSARTPSAVYAEGPNAGQPMISGFNAAGAWKLTRGAGSVAIAILDTGIKWDRRSLRTKVRLNPGELPLPRHDRSTPVSDSNADCSAYKNAYDADGNGAVDVLDYACDSRSDPTAGAEGDKQALDPSDLIALYSNGTDSDGNGYVDDIAGWDFFGDDNDPFDQSSYFAAKNHGSGRAEEAAARTDDSDGEPAVCPKCHIVPLRVWDTFVSDQNSFALAILYAADNGVKVIEGADGGLYHSDFAEHAVDYAYRKGVVQTYSGNDLNTGDHNYPANYDHTMLIQGTVPDTVGLGQDLPAGAKPFLQQLGVNVSSSVPTETYFRGAGTTQYGGHSSVAMTGSTGSENTGKASGAAGMVIGAALPIVLRPDETREILEQTAEDVTGGPTGVDGNVKGVGSPDYAQPGWDPHFGWGRVDVGKAVALAASGKIPPEAAISSPDWFAPLTGKSVAIGGLARARFATGGGHFTWKLEWGPGLAPTTWTTVREGQSTSEVTDFGSIDLDAVRAALASYTPPVDPGMPTFTPSANPYQQQFAVRLTVTGDGIPTPGVDRKVLTAFTDPTLRPGYPKRMAAGGEAPATYADIDGDGRQELILPLEDGSVHAFRPDGSELPGWPVRTDTQWNSLAHTSAPGVAAIGAPREPPRAVAVSDLDGDGTQELVTTAGLHVYAWEPDGSRRPGFPVSVDRAFCRSQDQSQPLHHRKCGFLASPALGRLEGAGGGLDIVAPALDGRVYAIRPDGSTVPGFPVALVDPGVKASEQMLAESVNDAAIGDLNGDGRDDVVAASNEVYGAQQPSGDDIAGLFAQGFADLLANAAGGSTRVYAINGATGKFLPGWPIKLNGGIQDVLPLVGPGHDPSLLDGQVIASATGGALSVFGADGSLVRGMQQSDFGAASAATDKSGALNLFESASIGDVLGTGQPSIVKYQTSLAAAANLLLTGQNVPWQHLIGAFDASTGKALPAWPAVTDDYQFLSSSSIAKVDPSSSANQVLAGTGLGMLHAYDGLTGRDVAGFPKQTGGWLFAPPALSQDQRMADITREGFLFEWTTQAATCQGEWPDFRHDPQRTGSYGRDGTPPGAPVDPRLFGGQVIFGAPGDDGVCGALTGKAHYEVSYGSASRTRAPGPPAPSAPGTTQAVDIPTGTTSVSIRAVDDAGNVGPAATLRFPATASAGSALGAGGAVGAGGELGQLPGRGSPSSTACAAAAGFRSASVRPRGGTLRFAFRRAVARPVTVDVVQVSRGRRVLGGRRVARFTGRRAGFTWKGKRGLTDGVYYARLTIAGETRRVALRRVRGRFRARPAYFGRTSCGLIRTARLTRPAFGGRTGRPVALTYRLTRTATVSVTVLRGKKVVKRFKSVRRAAGRSYRAALRPKGLRRGDYRFRVSASAGSSRAVQVLTSRKV